VAEESILTDDFLRELMNVGEVDILVGVRTYNDEKTIGQVVQALRSGLLQFFPRQRAVIINADGGSRDATQDLVRAASISDLHHVANLQTLRTLHCISTQYPGGQASGNAFYSILAAADLLHPSMIAVISGHSTQIEPEWMARLLQPICRDNFDLVSPVYRRHKFDGLLVRNLVYPMGHALYSQFVKEPRPSEFALSGALATHFLGLDIWSQEAGRTGAGMLLPIAAITGGFKPAQIFLGSRERVQHSESGLVPAMRQTVGTLFWSMEKNFPVWSGAASLPPIPTIGGEPQITLEPLRINRKRLFEMFRTGVAELEPVLQSILRPSTLSELQRLAAIPEEQFRFEDNLWARAVYEFAVAYHKAVINRDHIIQALAPLYRGKTFTFLIENRDSSAEKVESNVERLCLTFERLKPYLLELWDGVK